MLDIWDELLAAERRMDSLFKALPGTIGGLAPFTRGGAHAFLPVGDVFARNGDLVIDLQLPGIDPAKDVTVTYEDGQVVVRGERKRTEEVKEEDYYRKETEFGAFERRVAVPEGTKDADIRAEYKSGILEITVPSGAKKIEVPKATSIPITTST